MPSYDYRCGECRKKFTLKQTFEEHDHKKLRCPKCGAHKVERLINPVFTKTSKKS
jgi:putative FmdB family regulatory protein